MDIESRKVIFMGHGDHCLVRLTIMNGAEGGDPRLVNESGKCFFGS
jgi:hypothetical protein